MRAIDADALTEDCKRYLGTLNPDKDGKECTRIHWLIGVIENAPTIEPEPCDDAVSRAEVLKIFDDCKNASFVWGVMKSRIEELPSVTPKQRTGKWTKDCACEICGFKPWYERDIHTLSFCPNCGADLREDQTDDNRPG